MIKTRFKGQSMVEVLVAVGAMSLLLVALLSLVVLSVKNSRLANDRSQAVTLAQEGVELMRAYRDFSWASINSSARVLEYNLPKNWVVSSGLIEDCNEVEFDIYSTYRRCVSISSPDTQTIDVAVRTAWQEGSNLHEVVQVTKLTLWER